MGVLRRNNITISGKADGETLIFVHGYGCDQNMWRAVASRFEPEYRVVLLDLVGFGNSDLSAYNRAKYASLEGHADDMIEVIEALGSRPIGFIGHSVSSMIALLASNKRPDLFRFQVMVAPSPHYINEPEYHGGFDRSEIEELLTFLDSNFFGWTQYITPIIAGPDGPRSIVDTLSDSFCRTDPTIAKHFGRVTFLSDHRADVARNHTPTLILQVRDDALAPIFVGNWLHTHLKDSELTIIDTIGHCPHLSAPEATIGAIESFLRAHAFDTA